MRSPQSQPNLAQPGLAEPLLQPEIINRLDEILVFSPLRRRHLERIFDKSILDLQA